MQEELRAWRIYGAISTLAFVVLATSAFTVARQRVTFGTIDVQRINIVEPDGTLRMVISDKTRFPGEIINGKDFPHDRNTAGMLFYNDEGTENGGLIFGGQKNGDGTVSSYGHLSFDQYEQDQMFSLDAGQDQTGRSTRIAFIDQPDWPIGDIVKLPASQWPHFLATHPRGTSRLTMARNEDGSTSLALKDQRGHTRILMQVGADGAPVVQLLDPKGRIISQLPH